MATRRGAAKETQSEISTPKPASSQRPDTELRQLPGYELYFWLLFRGLFMR